MSLIESKGNRNNSNICDRICSFNPCHLRVFLLNVEPVGLHDRLDVRTERKREVKGNCGPGVGLGMTLGIPLWTCYL